jgi:hypothetical protein
MLVIIKYMCWIYAGTHCEDGKDEAWSLFTEMSANAGMWFMGHIEYTFGQGGSYIWTLLPIISVGFWRWCVGIERIVLLDFIHRLVSQKIEE